MCGILGALNLSGGTAPDLAPFLEHLGHRGPDGKGQWTDGRCTLGHTRLSVIELSSLGDQPMADASGRFHLVFNGEIYNFRELRTELAALGHTFRGGSDTEVLLAAIAQWGQAAPSRLRGMFAYAVWDAAEGALTLVRDRLGKKPLYYGQIDGRLWFGSEVAALAAVPGFDRTVDHTALDLYLTYGYISAPATGFAGLSKLPPASVMRVRAGEQPGAPDIWWSPLHEPTLEISYHDAIEELRRLMTQAVSRRMIADVPIGGFLSGGIDSSIVVGLMAQQSSRQVRTFSIGFTEDDYSELPHARRIAELWGTDHTEHVVEPDAAAILPDLVAHYGEPYADSSALPTYYLAQRTRRQVTVALSGDGGDESFAGYDRYWGMELAGQVRRVPGAARLLGAVASRLPDGEDFRDPRTRAKRFLSAAALTPSSRYARWSTYFSPQQKRELYGEVLRPALDSQAAEEWMEELFRSAAARTPAERAMSADIRSYLPYDLNVKVDIASMIHSLEVRAPFLDVDVMEFAARLPLAYKLRRRTGKQILRDAFADLLPAANVNRPKMGFGVPVGRWFRGPLRDLVEDALLSEISRSRGLLDPQAAQGLLAEHMTGTVDHSARLWSLVTLELWHRRFIDQTSR